MPSPYSILEPVCTYTGANIHSNLPPRSGSPTSLHQICRRIPSQAELSSANRIFASTFGIFLILLLPWLLLGVKFLEHEHKYWIMGLGVLLHLNTCLFVYTEGVAMGMMYVRSVGCTPVQSWEREEVVEAEREEGLQAGQEGYKDDMDEVLDIEKIAATKDAMMNGEGETTKFSENIRSFKPVGGMDDEFCVDVAAEGTMHGQFGP